MFLRESEVDKIRNTINTDGVFGKIMLISKNMKNPNLKSVQFVQIKNYKIKLNCMPKIITIFKTKWCFPIQN